MAAPKPAHVLLITLLSLLILADSGIAAPIKWGEWVEMDHFSKRLVDAASGLLDKCLANDDCLEDFNGILKKFLDFKFLSGAKSRKEQREDRAGGGLTQYKFVIHAKDSRATGANARCWYEITLLYIVENKTISHATIHKRCP